MNDVFWCGTAAVAFFSAMASAHRIASVKRMVERQAVESRSNEAEKVREELAEIAKTVRGLRDRVASLEMQVDAIIALVQP